VAANVRIVGPRPGRPFDESHEARAGIRHRCRLGSLRADRLPRH
jgi:hypothetical protein